MLGIGDGSPMNESGLLMMSLLPVLLSIEIYHNSSPLNYIDVRACVYDLVVVGFYDTFKHLKSSASLPT